MNCYLDAVILSCLHKIKGERTIYSIYHLLKGKKSSQTIQDAHFYQLTTFFQTFPAFERQSYERRIKLLFQQGLLTTEGHPIYVVTEEGAKSIKQYFTKVSFPKYLNGYQYQHIASIFWRRFTFFIQVLSHLIRKERAYYPIERDPVHLEWLKRFITNAKQPREQLAACCYDELFSLLSNNPPEDPRIIAVQLTGVEQIGKTVQQTADLFGIEKTECWFRSLNLLHFMLESIISKRETYPLLYGMLADLNKGVYLTNSAEQTYRLLKKHYSLQDIAVYRKLKINTVEDHIIEIALSDPYFQLTPYVDEYTTQEIINIAAQIGGKKLRPLKEHLPNVTYFQIRLVLAALGVKHGIT